MILRNVKLKNFRPYRDIEFDFSDPDGHIHIIEGPQGAGKTSFHRAIQWGLYGDTQAPNYRENWNNLARENDEEMFVELTFRDVGETFIVRRELDLDSVSHDRKRIWDNLRVIAGGEEEYTEDDAQDWINSRLPEDLKDFFFLDGEQIREQVTKGHAIKEDVETVLKHTAILNAREDLEDVLYKRYQENLKQLEGEIEERDELNEEIDELEEERKELRSEVDELDDERIKIRDELIDLREMLEDQETGLMRELEELEDKIADLVGDKTAAEDNLREAWEKLPIGILSEEIDQVLEDLREEKSELRSKQQDVHRHDIISDLAAEAAEEACPICGNTDVQTVDGSAVTVDSDTSIDKIEERIVQLTEFIGIMEDIPEFETPPSEFENLLMELKSDIDDKRARRKELTQELGGAQGTDKDELEDTIDSLESQIDTIEDDIEDIQKEIEEIDDEIADLTDEKQGLAGGMEIDELNAKIEATGSALEALKTVRDAHIEKKRDQIRAEMNDIFELVSRSEFISTRYKGIDFSGDPEDDDKFVLQLIRKDGTPKDMTEGLPSAGETQLTALSFTFGLNAYANYSTTIVFDTVAGRLDLDNSHAQGEFFASLDDPIILLVHDGELAKMENAIEGHVGRHFKLTPEGEAGQTFTKKEVVE